MRERILAKGVSGEKVAVIPPWSHDEHVFYDAPGRESFRRAYTLEGKFVVMYSGNHSPCHPLDTLLAAARRLSHDPGIVFCFVGGGSEYRKIEAEVRATTPANILCLPYQPLERLAASLSAADLHVVVMGDAFVGTIHPCKIYNILGVGAPVLYIGPQPSHLSDILQAADGSFPFASAGHGEVDKVVRAIQRLRSETKGIPRAQPLSARSKFSKESLLPRLVGELEAQVVS
jgi:glycosyltransferase involved in cell wall biosynthesis